MQGVDMAEHRAKIYPPVQELWILQRQVPPNRRLWMLGLVIPGETTGTLIYSDKGGPSLSSGLANMHPVFERLQSLNNPVHKLLTKECIGTIKREDLHCLGGFYPTIVRSELDDLTNERWILSVLLCLAEVDLIPRKTFRKWALIFTSTHNASPSSSQDSLQAYDHRPYIPDAQREPGSYESIIGGVVSQLDTIRVSHRTSAANREPSQMGAVMPAKARLASQGRGPSTPRVNEPRTRLASTAPGSSRSAQPSSLKKIGTLGGMSASSEREESPNRSVGRRRM